MMELHQVLNHVFAGVDIGGTKTAVVLSSAPPSMLARSVFQTEPQHGAGAAIQSIVDSLHSALASKGLTAAHLRAIGVSCGGPLNPDLGMIQEPPNLATWKDVPITSILAREFGCSCYLDNDGNAGALAEHSFGAGRGARNLIFLTMGTGLGAGLILNGQLYRGSSHAAGEIGHVRLTRTGPFGHNKFGSAEGWASGAGLAQVARTRVSEVLAQGGRTQLASCVDDLACLTARSVAEAAENGDLLAQQLIRSTGERLGEAMAILVDLINPECIIVGGLGVRLGDALLDPAREVIKREALAGSAAACAIKPAALGEQIGDVAAICVAIDGEARNKPACVASGKHDDSDIDRCEKD